MCREIYKFCMCFTRTSRNDIMRFIIITIILLSVLIFRKNIYCRNNKRDFQIVHHRLEVFFVKYKKSNYYILLYWTNMYKTNTSNKDARTKNSSYYDNTRKWLIFTSRKKNNVTFKLNLNCNDKNKYHYRAAIFVWS